MRPEDIRRLVGGYATGTLTDEERHALLEAALRDQDLFNELARDQPLRDLLEDPLARRQLLDALEEKPSLANAWLRRPATWALAGGLAAAAVLLVVFVRPPSVPPKPEPVLMAKLEAPQEVPPPAVAAPAPVRVPEKAAPAANETKSALADKAKVEVAEVAAPQPVDSAVQEKGLQAPAALEKRRLSGAVGSIEPGSARISFQAREADMLPSPIPYRFLRAGPSGDFVEAASTTVFAKDDRIRLVFEPAQSGRLRAVSSSSQTLIDLDVQSATTATLDVPPGETRVTGTFRAIPFEVQIRRE
jgi:hypothetical protein